MDTDPESADPESAGRAGGPVGTVYGRGGVPVSDPKPGLFDRLHPAITAAIAASIIAVSVLGYLAWRSSINAETSVAVGPTAGAVALPQEISTPETSPSPSPSPSPTGAELAPGTWSLESVDYAGGYIRRKGDRGVVEKIDAASDARARREATLIVTDGLADRSCFTFRTGDGRYLRHFDFRLRFDKPDDSEIFREDATFCADAGATAGSVRLRSHNYPDRAIHHRDSELWLDQADDSEDFSAASSFTVRPSVA